MIIVAALVLSGIAASGTAFLEFSADNRVYFAKDNPQLVAAEAMENTYGETRNVFFAVVPENRDATSALALEAALWLTDRAWQIPFATRVDSLTNFQHSTAAGDEIVVRDLVEGGDLGDSGERARIRAIALAEPLLAGRLIARDGGVSGVNATVALPGEDQMRESGQVAEASYGLADQVRARFPGIDVRVTGQVTFNQAFMLVSISDLKTLVPASFAAMTLTLLYLTGGLGGTFAIMLVAALSAMASVGLGGWVGLPMTAAGRHRAGRRAHGRDRKLRSYLFQPGAFHATRCLPERWRREGPTVCIRCQEMTPSSGTQSSNRCGSIFNRFSSPA